MKQTTFKKWRGVAGLYLTVVVLWIGCPLVVSKFAGDWQSRGQVGDTFGAVNALFSALAFATLIVTLRFQQKDMAEQISEMRRSRIMDEKPLVVVLPRQFAVLKRFGGGRASTGGKVELSTSALFRMAVQNASGSPAINVCTKTRAVVGNNTISAAERRTSVLLRDEPTEFEVALDITATDVLSSYEGFLLSTKSVRPTLCFDVEYGNLGGAKFTASYVFDIRVIDEQSGADLQRLVRKWLQPAELASDDTQAKGEEQIQSISAEPDIRLELELRHDSFKLVSSLIA